MGDGANRIGTVSGIDPETGMVSVYFEDRDNEVSDFLPYATFGGAYKPLKPGDMVLVACIGDGEDGVVLGTFWNEDNPAGRKATAGKES